MAAPTDTPTRALTRRTRRRRPVPRAVPPGADPLVGARVLVVGVDYWPDTTGIAPYTTGAAEHLAALGAHVHVVTGIPHYPSWTPSPDHRAPLSWEDRGGVRVARARHYVPAKQDALRRGAFELSWLAGAAVQDALTRADAVVAVSPNLSALPLARWAAARRGVRWAAVVQDLMGNAAANGGVRGGARVSGAVGRVEAAMLRSADLVGVIGEGFGDAVTRMGVDPGRIRLLPNWSHVTPSASDQATARARLGWRQDVLTAVHTGNMGAKQGLDNVVEAAREADRRGARVELVLVGDGSCRRELERLAEGVRSLRFVDPVDADEYPDVLAAADVLLVNERSDMLEMSLPSKLTSYLVSGRPVVAAVPPSGWTAAVLDESGAAVRVPPADPAALLDAVTGLGADQAARQRMSAAGVAYARSRYGQEAGVARYADVVRELLGGARSAPHPPRVPRSRTSTEDS